MSELSRSEWTSFAVFKCSYFHLNHSNLLLWANHTVVCVKQFPSLIVSGYCGVRSMWPNYTPFTSSFLRNGGPPPPLQASAPPHIHSFSMLFTPPASSLPFPVAHYVTNMWTKLPDCIIIKHKQRTKGIMLINLKTNHSNYFIADLNRGQHLLFQ